MSRLRFPELSHLLGAYFHQDFPFEYTSHEEALADYLSGASEADRCRAADEIREFLSAHASDADLEKAAAALGLGVSPPRGRLRRWLVQVQAAMQT
ncbi:contact-dependent growth inhibition system immunity protein [Streptomyces sp. NPDC046876]|uniref:contact-dependent growth inhibition system immunity protein n=1 Tax=Streptomyces sp. NPDC046876 TaxID=3155616 RepID=UPI0033C3D8A2